MAQKRILIVDDEKLVRWALNQKCAEFGFQMHGSGDGTSRPAGAADRIRGRRFFSTCTFPT